jgi:hypothetical protein
LVDEEVGLKEGGHDLAGCLTTRYVLLGVSVKDKRRAGSNTGLSLLKLVGLDTTPKLLENTSERRLSNLREMEWLTKWGPHHVVGASLCQIGQSLIRQDGPESCYNVRDGSQVGRIVDITGSANLFGRALHEL